MSREVYDDLEKSLEELYSEVSLPPAGLGPARGRMLAEAAQLLARQVGRPLSTAEAGHIVETRRRRKMNLMLVYKALAAVLAVAVAIAGMGGGVVLAADTLPGDFLYPVKLLSEDVRLALTPDPAGRAELEMSFVALRVQEMAQLAQRGEEVPQAVVMRMTRQMEQVMVEIAKARPEDVPALLERVTQRTRLHQQVLEGAAAGSSAETQTRLHQASQVMERVRLNAESDPMYLEYQYQQRYEGEPGPHSGVTPVPLQEQVREEERHRYEGAVGPYGDATATPTLETTDILEQDEATPPDSAPGETQEQYQYGQEATPGPRGQQSPPSGDEPEPTGTPQKGGNPDKGH